MLAQLVSFEPTGNDAAGLVFLDSADQPVLPDQVAERDNSRFPLISFALPELGTGIDHKPEITDIFIEQ